MNTLQHWQKKRLQLKNRELILFFFIFHKDLFHFIPSRPGSFLYLHVFMNRGIKIKAASGTSAGAIFALFVVLGIKYKQVKNIFYNINLQDFQNLSINNLFENFGLDSGEGPMNFFKAVVRVITGKDSTTFAELYEKTILEMQKFQNSLGASYLKGSNLDDKLYK